MDSMGLTDVENTAASPLHWAHITPMDSAQKIRLELIPMEPGTNWPQIW